MSSALVRTFPSSSDLQKYSVAVGQIDEFDKKFAGSMNDTSQASYFSRRALQAMKVAASREPFSVASDIEVTESVYEELIWALGILSLLNEHQELSWDRFIGLNLENEFWKACLEFGSALESSGYKPHTVIVRPDRRPDENGDGYYFTIRIGRPPI
jgi:hypothetical protein